MNEVKTPTGKSVGAIIVLARVSETRSRRAPKSAEIGIKNL